MIVYLVIADNVTFEEMEQLFPGNVYPLRNANTYLIGSAMPTCADVNSAIGFGAHKGSGLVLKVGEYYGHYDQAVWQKMEAWRQQA
ncbi:MAG: hypothetical protein OXH52_10550 [Gammaproteobacteria bacterium]|nr:hypothetical protein [Gammaproteobacteria bacterium]